MPHLRGWPRKLFGLSIVFICLKILTIWVVGGFDAFEDGDDTAPRYDWNDRWEMPAEERDAWSMLEGTSSSEANVDLAVGMFRELSVRGVASAHFALGLIYATGLANVTANPVKALLYYKAAALQGYVPAQMALASRLRSGYGFEKNCRESSVLYESAAEHVIKSSSFIGGRTVLRLRLYDIYESESDVGLTHERDLLNYYEFLVDKGDMNARATLGVAYLSGRINFIQNEQKALEYLLICAEQIDQASAMAYLGKMYFEGTHANSKDYKKAFYYFSKAAALENPIGQVGLGLMYSTGKHVKTDKNMARKFFEMAAATGYHEAQLQLGIMHMSGTLGRKKPLLAVKYFSIATQQGNTMAAFNLGRMHHYGLGVPRSCSLAVEFYRKVAERGRWSYLFNEAYQLYSRGEKRKAMVKYAILSELGYEVGSSNLAFMYEEQGWSNTSGSDRERALFYWKHSAEENYDMAKIRVGDYYYYGLANERDFKAALKYYRLSADDDFNAQAMFNTAYMYERGLGVKRDLYIAKRYYDMALESSSDAFIPVSMALVKLSLLFFWDYIKSSYVYEISPDLSGSIGRNWDLVLIGFIVGSLTILWVERRQRMA